MEYRVNFTWDDEANVWIAQSDDIPGLVLEGGSLDALFERVRFAAPELIELNKTPALNSLCFSVERHEKVFA
jgi:predicted RNase H-like HicB family nuclease